MQWRNPLADEMRMAGSTFLTQYPLLRNIIIYIFLFATILTLFFTGINIFFSYINEKSRIEEHLESLEQSQYDVLVTNIWKFNNDTVRIQLNSILQSPDIIYIELININRETLTFGEKPGNHGGIIIRTYNLKYFHIDKMVPLGTLKIHAGIKRLQSEILRQVPIILATEFIKQAIICGFILLLFLLLFNRHLNKIVLFTQRLQIDSLDQKLHLGRNKPLSSPPDELDRITFSINDMRERLQIGINQKTQAEQSLRESEEKYRQIYNTPYDAIFLHDAITGRILDVNQTMCELYGYTHKEALKLSVASMSADTETYTNDAALSLIQKTTLDNVQNFEWHCKKKNGDLFWAEVALKRCTLAGEERVIAVVRDISRRKIIEVERNHLQASLLQSQKMESIGTLAGGIAHDFNNILSSIVGYNQYAMMNMNKPEKLQECHERIQEASLRAKDLVQQILTFSRRNEQQKAIIKLGDVITEAVKLLRSTIPSTVEIRQTIKTDSMILADSTQMHQIILNLCTNGYQALQNKPGTLSVRLTEVVIHARDKIFGLDVSPGKYVLLEVSDTGCGIDKEASDKIFEPYFTTKQSGAGTGLGLAVVHGIIGNHNGQILVYSEPGIGSTFKIYLPVVDSEGSENRVSIENDSVTRGSETILFVDDEEFITKLNKDVLEDFGYTVSTFTDPNEALIHFKENSNKYDLIITDMTMPGMTGSDLATKILAINPGIAIILCTGFSENINEKEAIDMGLKAYLNKPILLNDLLTTVRKVLDAVKPV